MAPLRCAAKFDPFLSLEGIEFCHLATMNYDGSCSIFPLKVPSIAMVLHSSEHELFLTAPGERKLSLRSMVNDEAVRNFFSGIVSDALGRMYCNSKTLCSCSAVVMVCQLAILP